MQIGILETGRPAPALARDFGTYADMVAHLLADGETVSFRRFWLQEDDFPEDIRSCDAWTITGSRSSVTEELPWMLRLEALLREAAGTGWPVIGICFGHQILAKALGADVRQAANGWQLGLKDYELTDRPSWLKDAPGRLRLNAIHQDQVLEVPPGATLLASSPDCPIAALTYGNWAVTLQAHPEFSIPFEQALLSSCVGKTLPEQPGRVALAELDKADAATDADLVARGLLRFLRER
ncbi:type 1 glutamine amidotransferase [Telmatospirillum sp.]|uniref:type 1 glutamine amidotransferase n=1 Tax=Telmatospirillum sp. TaxID=2079197 RepID=UPI002846A687|nr:type 1 glutamine amidotransferase [Telmatospirillum sp.]MDR3441267.1 type 1 glutamine amidotransferase [Telmatospirillum sp.]